MGFFETKATKKSKTVPIAGVARGKTSAQKISTQKAAARTAVSTSKTELTALARNNAPNTSRTDPLLVQTKDSDDNSLLEFQRREPQKKISFSANTVDKHAQGQVKPPTPVNSRLASAPSTDTGVENMARYNGPTPKFFCRYENPSIESNPTDDSGFSLVQTGSLLRSPDAFVTSSLVQWKFAAEEGHIIIRIFAVLGALTVMVTTFLPLYLEEDKITISYVIISVYSVLLSILIVALDARSFCGRNPVSCRAKLRNLITRNCNVFKLVFGRSFLYMFVGGLQCSQMQLISLYSGCAMIVIGFIALIVGWNASKNLANLKSSLTDDDFLWSEFNKHDSDADGLLTPSDFSKFIWSLGLDFDDVHTLKAFLSIDKDRDKKIDYVQFRQWWSQCSQFVDDVEVLSRISET